MRPRREWCNSPRRCGQASEVHSGIRTARCPWLYPERHELRDHGSGGSSRVHGQTRDARRLKRTPAFCRRTHLLSAMALRSLPPGAAATAANAHTPSGLHRRVFSYVYSDGAGHALLSSSSSSRAMLRVRGKALADQAETPTCTWYSRVPSASNIADAPSRGAIEELTLVCAVRDPVGEELWKAALI